MGHVVRKSDFVACEQQSPDQPAHPRSLVSGFLDQSLDGRLAELATYKI